MMMVRVLTTDGVLSVFAGTVSFGLPSNYTKKASLLYMNDSSSRVS